MSRGLCVTILALVFLLLIGFFAERYEQAGSAVAAIFGVIVGAAITAGSQFMISGYERHHQLRMAALERRLQAHQEAFALWAKLFSNLRKPEFDDVYKECQDWWYSNCVYLEDEVRKAFRDTYLDALSYNDLAGGGAAYDTLRDLFLRIQSLGNIILRAISLPPIRELETEISSMVRDFQEHRGSKK